MAAPTADRPAAGAAPAVPHFETYHPIGEVVLRHRVSTRDRRVGEPVLLDETVRAHVTVEHRFRDDRWWLDVSVIDERTGEIDYDRSFSLVARRLADDDADY